MNCRSFRGRTALELRAGVASLNSISTEIALNKEKNTAALFSHQTPVPY